MQSLRSRQSLPYETLAGYEVVAKIRTGGMATLFLGRKTGAGGFAKYVAIKVILDSLAEEPALVAMFLDEARLSARIEHPNVVHIHALGEEEGKHFLVMEYVAGCSLSQLQRAVMRRQRRFAPSVVAYMGMQVAAGLHAAHEATDDHGESLHVVHRDVSPKNILIAFKGYVKLIDFGIAKVRDASQSTSAGSLKGTIRYMSPEQASGVAIDRRSDIYSLGIVLWEMLTGRPLFQAATELAALDMVRHGRVPLPSHFGSVPPELEAVVMKMLAASPDERYATADEAQRALAMAVPAALSFSPQKLGELVAALMPAQPDRDIDPSIASALGRPVAVADPEEIVSRFAVTLDGSATEAVEPTSGVSGQVTRSYSSDARDSLVVASPAPPRAQSTGPSPAVAAPVAPQASDAWRWIAPVVVAIAVGAAATLAWALRTTPATPEPVVTQLPLDLPPATVPVVPPSTIAVVPPVPTTSELAPPTQPTDSTPGEVADDGEPGAPRGGRGGRGGRSRTETASSTEESPRTGPESETSPTPPATSETPHRRATTHVTSDPVISTTF
ncbi:MAG: serine/threonine-protein kinase [Sandaracinus sp.]